MPEKSIKNKTTKGILWSAVERFSVQGAQFLVMLIIARILAPEDFGLVGMLTIFIAVADSIVNSGFSQALIRKQDRTDTDNSTVFYFNVVISVIIYILLYTIAPFVADFYGVPQLIILMRVLCLEVVISSFGVVQLAIYTAEINFKVQAKATLTGAIVSGAVGIFLAWYGYGVWALVWQHLANVFVRTLLLWVFSSWYPRWAYSWKSFKVMFGFGSKLLISGLIDTIYNNLYQIIIGKVFSASALGHFTQAKHFPNVPASTITNIIQRVTYPSLCTMQDDDERLKEAYRELLRLSAFVVFPLMCLLAGIANPLVEILIGSKWHYAATLIVPLSFSMMWYPIQAINLNLLKVKGRSDWFLKLEIIKKIFGALILVATIPFGVTIMCWARILSTLISLIINTYYSGVLIRMGFFAQMKDFFPTLIASVMMFVVAYSATLFIENYMIQLIIGTFFSVFFYVGIAYVFKFKEIQYLRSILASIIRH